MEELSFLFLDLFVEWLKDIVVLVVIYVEVEVSVDLFDHADENANGFIDRGVQIEELVLIIGFVLQGCAGEVGQSFLPSEFQIPPFVEFVDCDSVVGSVAHVHVDDHVDQLLLS